jgi:hypothetical protein
MVLVRRGVGTCEGVVNPIVVHCRGTLTLLLAQMGTAPDEVRVLSLSLLRVFEGLVVAHIKEVTGACWLVCHIVPTY